jgi:ribosomal protein S12 methylthiotransferase accessory factor
MKGADPLSLEVLVDSRVGILRSCIRLPKDRREPSRPVMYEATLSNFDNRRVPHERTATGRGPNVESARLGAIVEALERYCAFQRPPEALVVSAASALDGPSIAPHELVLYSDRQYDTPGFRYRRPDVDEQLTWVRGHLLGSEQPVYAPASAVYMGFVGARGREFFAPSTSNGLAGGQDLPSAVLAGLCELVERDAFVITWLNRLPAPRIDFSDSAGISAEIRRHYRRFGIEMLAFDVTTDLQIPVVMAVAIDRSGALPAATVGLGCHLEPAIALDRAVTEVVQVRAATAWLYRREPSPPRIRRYEDVRTIADHAALAAAPEYLREFDFLFENACLKLADIPDRRRGDVVEDLDFCRKRLEAAGCTVAYVDLTLPDLESFDVRIVRAIATGLQPIHFGFGEERLGGRRLFAVPRLLGHETRERTEDDLFPCPHPLA